MSFDGESLRAVAAAQLSNIRRNRRPSGCIFPHDKGFRELFSSRKQATRLQYSCTCSRFWRVGLSSSQAPSCSATMKSLGGTNFV
eukprot:9469025-Pyramimonas_sp.AAC.1